MSLFSDFFNKKKLDSITEDKQKELENNGSPSFESEGREDPRETMEVSEEEEVEYEVVEREIHPAKIICPDCGGITLEGLEFCDKCGGELL
ncbi:MAG: hypothetical protein K0S04_1201 [Herbinix sp.]|nr:hypothetical protein [Herbinix sp.]